jgi:hypothetical protein
MRTLIGAACLAALAAGCTPVKPTKLETPPAAERADVLVYRESAFNAGGIGMVFGANKVDFLEMGNNTYVEIPLRAGEYELFVRSTQADQPYVLKTALAPADKKCFRAYANPSNIGKAVLLPFAYYMGHTFLLDEVACPAAEALANYTRKEAQYQ